MKTIYFDYQPKKHISGTGVIKIDDCELDVTEKQLLKGASEHLVEVICSAWVFFDLTPGDFDGLNRINDETFSKLSSGEYISFADDDDYMARLLEVLSVSLLFANLAINSLCKGDYQSFARYYGLSERNLGSFHTSITFVKYSDAGSPEGIKSALALHLKAASDKASEQHRKIKEKVLAEYRTGTFKSKNQAAEQLSRKHGRSVAVVRGWLQGI